MPPIALRENSGARRASKGGVVGDDKWAKIKFPMFYSILLKDSGGEEGIRTLDTGLPHTPLAGERLRPLGHLSICGDTEGGWPFQAI